MTVFMVRIRKMLMTVARRSVRVSMRMRLAGPRLRNMPVRVMGIIVGVQMFVNKFLMPMFMPVPIRNHKVKTQRHDDESRDQWGGQRLI